MQLPACNSPPEWESVPMKEATGIRIGLYRIPNRKDKNSDVSASRLSVTTG